MNRFSMNYRKMKGEEKWQKQQKEQNTCAWEVTEKAAERKCVVMSDQHRTKENEKEAFYV